MAKVTLKDIQTTLKTLTLLAEESEQLLNLSESERIELLKAAGKLSRPDRDEIRKRNKQVRLSRQKKVVEKDRQARQITGIRKARTSEIFTAPHQLSDPYAQTENNQVELSSARNCYVCKAEFTTLHHFYDTMCKKCGDFNYQKRFPKADLNNTTTLITGARLKIGYHAALMLLRSGSQVVVVTRFPIDAAMRFAKEKDFKQWQNRLHIHGLDLRHTPSVELFARFFEHHYERLDFLINNAAQTVRKPPGFYNHLMAAENKPFTQLSSVHQQLLKNHQTCKNELLLHGAQSMENEHNNGAMPTQWQGQTPGVGISNSAALSQIPYSYDATLANSQVFPEGQLDVDLQQVDLRKTNSWRLKIGEIEAPEMLEVQLVNAVAPFVLANRLVKMMRLDFTGKKHIVNVTAMEGKFYRFKKADRHPHTNMAKAALNMLTHTSASDLAKDGIFMNAVDTGWVTDEDPAALAHFKQEKHDFQPPLDIVDGAARIVDPIFDGILTGQHWCGKFLKDYFPIDW